MTTGIISILGCGWLGKPLGNFLVKRGFTVKGSTTRKENFPHIQECGIFPYLLKLGDALEGERIEDFFAADVIIISIPPMMKTTPGEDFINKIKIIRDHIVENRISVKTIFISSTSVYFANRAPIEESNEFIDSDSPLYKAELLLREINATVLRFAGLVGPGRHPGKFLSGKRTTGADDPVNLIHLDDCIGILSRVIEGDWWGQTYNGCADEHPVREKFYNHACDLLGVPRPIFSGGKSSGYKIISNELVKRDLTYNFQFPDPLLMTY